MNRFAFSCGTLFGFALLLSAIPASAQASTHQGGNIPGPYGGGDYRPGPFHFCANHVAIDVAAGEWIIRRRGPESEVYDLHDRNGGGFGMYVDTVRTLGNATASPTIVAGFHAEKLHDASGGYSYIVRVPDASPPIFVYFYGAVWKGDASDAALLAHVQIGQPAAIHCEHPTFGH